ncbi:MAG: hypothetical protein ACRBDI_02305 [Alphaproteobacteria bacterium]
MSKEYAEEKIRESLSLHGGNTARARKHLISLAQNDLKLLSALTLPHLDGIVSYQVDRVASGRAELEKRHPESASPSIKKQDNFGMDLLRAVAASESTVFGQQNPVGSRRKIASKQHIDAIHKIAASRTKDDRKNRY